MKPSKQMDGLIEKKLAEWALGRPVGDDAQGLFMDRGSEQEIDAVHWYELTQDVELDRVGFLTTDDGALGCSPDGLVGATRGIEIKVPAAHTHVGYLLDPENVEYRAQIQCCLHVAEREDWHRLSYHPTMPKALTLFQRDDAFIKAMLEAFAIYREKFHEAKERLLKMGVVPVVPSLTGVSGTPKISTAGIGEEQGTVA
jgi:hypothetical protein